jgi:hypothetical protein
MQRKKVGLSLFVVGAVLLGLATWGGLLWYGLGIRTAYPFGIIEYPAMPAVDPFQARPFPVWEGFTSLVVSSHAAAMPADLGITMVPVRGGS